MKYPLLFVPGTRFPNEITNKLCKFLIELTCFENLSIREERTLILSTNTIVHSILSLTFQKSIQY